MKRIIAIINQKGGVGKTTTSINLACGLAIEGEKVLLIDLDPQGHSTKGLGYMLDDYTHAIHDVLINKKDIREIILDTGVKNFSLVPANLHLDKAEQTLNQEFFKESRLYKAIEKLEYDYIVIDCRPTLGTLTVNALYACNFIIVPVEMSRYALEGYAELVETIENVKKGNADSGLADLVRILFTKYDSRKTISIEWVMEQLEAHKDLILKTKIRQNEPLNQAHMAQEPIFTFKPNCAGSEDYMELTKEFLTICQ